MYEGFYELTSTPFIKGTAIDKLYMPPELSEVENRLHFVAERHLFATLTGECGTGKSTILRRLSESLDPRKYQMLYVSDSKLTPSSYYHLLLEQMGISSSWNRSTAKRQLHEQLSIKQAVDGISTVCVVDESHLLSYEMLEEIRFLLNMKFDSVSPISLILAGQPELWNKLQMQKCTAIRQRIDIQCRLNHYDASRTGDYIRHQLKMAGATNEIFTDKAIQKVFEYSGGIPRVIDKVCTSVLIYGSQNKLRLIDDHAVQMVLDGEFL